MGNLNLEGQKCAVTANFIVIVHVFFWTSPSVVYRLRAVYRTSVPRRENKKNATFLSLEKCPPGNENPAMGTAASRPDLTCRPLSVIRLRICLGAFVIDSDDKIHEVSE